MPNPVVHWAIMARNAQKRQEFYASLFGWQVDSSNPMGYGFVDSHTEADINGGIPPKQMRMNTHASSSTWRWTICRHTSTGRRSSEARL